MSNINSIDLHRFVAEIVKRADLKTMSSRKIRALCERRFRTDLTSRKKEIDQIVLHFLHEEEKRQEQESSASEESSDESESSSEEDSDVESHGKPGLSPSHSSDSESCSDSESSDHSEDEANLKRQPVKARPNVPRKKISGVPAKKAVKGRGRKAPAKKGAAKVAKKDVSGASCSESVEPGTSSTSRKKATGSESELEDEMLARILQAQEFNFRERTAKKYTEVALKRNVDSVEPKKRKASGYSRNCVLSADLAKLLKTKEMPRCDVVKKMWSVVRERELFDPGNRQFALCDEQLFGIFGKKRIRLFGMMKYLKHHIKDLDSTV